MKFNEFKYQRPNLDVVQEDLQKLIDIVGENNDLKTEKQAIDEFFKLSDMLDTLSNLVYIRNAVNTTDKFYEEEQNFFDENRPTLEEFTKTSTKNY